MKCLLFKSRRSLAAVALLLIGLMLTGCYNPQASGPVGGYPQAAQPGGVQPFNTNMGPPVMTPQGAPVAPATPATAVLRIGDKITIDWFDTPTPIPQYKDNIRGDGNLVLPLNVVVQAAGKTVGQLQDDIRSAYVPKWYIHLTPSVKTEELVYFVGGEVRVPNRQFWQEGITVLRAIDTAGGFTDFAKRSKIELRRGTGQIINVNWDKAMKNPRLDPPVQPNDQIMVHKRIF